MNRIAVEQRLRTALAGRRLVAEIDLEGSVFDEARAAIQEVVSDGNGPRVDAIAPATFVVYLVGLGIQSYDGGLWPAAAEDGVDPSWARTAFVDSLRALGLPDYAEETADGFEYIAKILFHGGIPRVAAATVLRMVHDALRAGEADAVEMVHAWRTNPWRLEALQRPGQRFLLHGGSEATDLIDRVIGLCRAKAEHRSLDPIALGLPSFWIVAMDEVDADDRAAPPLAPRPRVVFDIYGVDGPVLVLPPVDRSQGWSSWLVMAGSSVRHPETSAHRSLEVSLAPASWTATLEGADGRKLSWSFEPNTKVRVWFFSVDGESSLLARDQERITGPMVIALAPEGMEFRQEDPSGLEVPEPFELPALVGAWSGYRARVLNVAGTSRLWAGRPAEGGLVSAAATIPVLAARARPTLEGPIMAEVRTAEGWPVYASWPTLRLPDASLRPSLFRYRLVIDGPEAAEYTGTVDELVAAADGYQLDPGDGRPVADATLDVIGPLGSDLRGVRFAVVEGGLAVDRPERLLAPDERACLSVALPERVWFSAGRDVNDLVVPAGQDFVDATVTGASSSVTLRFQVDRLLWTFRAGSVTSPFGNDRLTIGLDDIESSQIDALMVRTGRPKPVELCLLDGDRTTVLARAETGGEGARWAFPLGRLMDTVRAADRARVKLQIRVPDEDLEADVADLHAKYEVTDLRVESDVDGELTVLEATWTENRAFPGRSLRLWPEYRPWDPPCVFPVPDGDGPCLLAEVDTSVPPGEYLAEVAVIDRWSRPVRPHRNRIDVVEVMVGSPADRRERLRSLDPNDARSGIEILLRGEPVSISVPDEQLVDVVGDVVASFVSLVAVEGKHALESPSAHGMNTLLFQDPDQVPGALYDLVLLDRCSDDDLFVASIALLPSALDCPLVDASAKDRERLFEVSPVLGMAMDRWPSDEESRDRWRRFLGWAPDADDAHRLPDVPGPVPEPLVLRDSDRLRALAAAVPEHLADDLDLRGRRGPLTFGGYVRAALSWLERVNDVDDLQVKLWRSQYSGLNDRRVRTNSDAERALDAITAKPTFQRLGKFQPINPPAILRFPPDVLAAAIHVTTMPKPKKAIAALWDASRFAPDLVTWACLMAVALYKSPT